MRACAQIGDARLLSADAGLRVLSSQRVGMKPSLVRQVTVGATGFRTAHGQLPFVVVAVIAKKRGHSLRHMCTIRATRLAGHLARTSNGRTGKRSH